MSLRILVFDWDRFLSWDFDRDFLLVYLLLGFLVSSLLSSCTMLKVPPSAASNEDD